MNPVLAPLAADGFAFLLASRCFRFMGGAALAVLGVLITVKAKNYYAAPLYPLLFAAGAVAFERATLTRRRLRPACAALLVVSGLALAPLVLPVLPIPQFLAYRRLWHGWTPVRFEALPPDLFPQQFSDEFGCDAMVRQTSAVYRALPAEERARTAIFANNYGEAAAVDFFGPRYGLPPAIGTGETYWLWGPRGYIGSTAIVLGSDGKGDREHFQRVEPVAHVGSPYVRSEERFDIFLCRGLKGGSLQALWPGMRKW